MNSLSWILYAAEVAEGVKDTLGAFGVIGLIVAALCGLFGLTFYSDNDMPAKQMLRGSGIATVCCTALVVLSVFIPSQRTIMLIAASEAGEAVATSEDGAEILSDLKTIIKQRIKDELPGKDDGDAE